MKRPLAVGLLAFALAMPAAAQPIKLVVPFAAGGPADLIARTLAAELPQRLNAEVIVENRGGAGGVIGTELVAKSPPDGKILLLASLGSHVPSAALRPRSATIPSSRSCRSCMSARCRLCSWCARSRRSPALPR
jgi:tripartite-type tricarboxylate transporter receptor subunit TctC